MHYTVDNLGINTYHGATWSHALPNGFPFWAFLHVVTPLYINEGDTMVLAEPGTCVLYPPGFPRYVKCAEGADGLYNDWVHFSCDDETLFRQTLAQHGIPLCRRFTLKQTANVMAILQDMVYEFSTNQPEQDVMLSALVSMLMVQVHRNMISYNEKVDLRAMQHLHGFEALRKKLYASPEQDWTLASMAGCVYLGQNQFINLYTDFFHITPKQDIINARLTKAKALLGSATVLRDVAIACGFKNEFYFSTVFKKHTGITPGQYALAHANGH